MWNAWNLRGQNITKEYKIKKKFGSNFGGYGGVGRYGGRYPRGYLQAIGTRVGYARNSTSGEGGNDSDKDGFLLTL